MITTEQINLMKDVIVETMQPEKIYLFGSYAAGTATEDSDIDVLIEVKTSDERPRLRSVNVNMELSNHRALRFPRDIFVYTTNEVAELEKNKYSFLSKALSKSKIIFSNV